MSMNILGIGSAIGQIQSALQSAAASAANTSSATSSNAASLSSSLTMPPSPSISDGQTSLSGAGTSFSDIISGAIGEVENAHNSAAQSVQQFLSGSGEDLHSTILATQRADLEFQMFMQVRNKVVSAYQEIMKLQM